MVNYRGLKKFRKGEINMEYKGHSPLLQCDHLSLSYGTVYQDVKDASDFGVFPQFSRSDL